MMHKYQKQNWGKDLRKAGRVSGGGAALPLPLESEGKTYWRISLSLSALLIAPLGSVPLTQAFTFM